MDTEGFSRFIATPAGFRLTKTEGGGGRITLDIPESMLDDGFKLARIHGKVIEIVWRELPGGQE